MKIIYYCFAGAHASVVASAIHCGLLPASRIPSYEEFLMVPHYDRTSPDLIGKPYLMGRDEYGHDVYFMGMRNQRKSVSAAILSLLDSAGINRQAYVFQDAFPLINFSTKVGGLLSKRYSLTGLGRLITVWGIQRQYPRFVDMVITVKKQLE